MKSKNQSAFEPQPEPLDGIEGRRAAGQSDSRPMNLTDLRRILPHRRPHLAPRCRFTLRGLPVLGRLISASMPPSGTVQSLSAPIDQSGRTSHRPSALLPRQQAAQRIEPSAGAIVERRLHGHAQFLKHGVLPIGSKLGRAQHPCSTTKSPAVQESTCLTSRFFYPEISFETRYYQRDYVKYILLSVIIATILKKFLHSLVFVFEV